MEVGQNRAKERARDTLYTYLNCLSIQPDRPLHGLYVQILYTQESEETDASEKEGFCFAEHLSLQT